MNKIVIIGGITGIGKTKVANYIAKKLNGEVIIGDSLQLYKNFKIGANFYDCTERTVPYHLLGEKDVYSDRISSFQYR